MWSWQHVLRSGITTDMSHHRPSTGSVIQWGTDKKPNTPDASVTGSDVTHHFKTPKKASKKPSVSTVFLRQNRAGDDNRRLHRLLNGLLQRRQSQHLPADNNIHDLATRFSTFFSTKIEIHDNWDSRASTYTFFTHLNLKPPQHPAPGESLPSATTTDIYNLLNKSPTTSYVLFPYQHGCWKMWMTM